jgi:hypothetical protein
MIPLRIVEPVTLAVGRTGFDRAELRGDGRARVGDARDRDIVPLCKRFQLLVGSNDRCRAEFQRLIGDDRTNFRIERAGARRGGIPQIGSERVGEAGRNHFVPSRCRVTASLADARRIDPPVSVKSAAVIENRLVYRIEKRSRPIVRGRLDCVHGVRHLTGDQHDAGRPFVITCASRLF